jgi:thioredoxin 1
MNKQEFQHQLQIANGPVVVEFWAEWCTPCRTTRPILQQLAEEFKGKITYLEIDADQSPDLIRELGVLAIPTLLVFTQGKEILRQVGAKSPQAYRGIFNSLAAGEAPPAAALSTFDRTLRLLAGLSVGLIGVLTHTGWLLILAAGLAFSAVYDRCPLLRALRNLFSNAHP